MRFYGIPNASYLGFTGTPIIKEELELMLEEKSLPEAVRNTVDKELDRIAMMQPTSAEYTVSRTYIDWILDLPWLESTEDNMDINHNVIFKNSNKGIHLYDGDNIDIISNTIYNPTGDCIRVESNSNSETFTGTRVIFTLPTAPFTMEENTKPQPSTSD